MTACLPEGTCPTACLYPCMCVCVCGDVLCLCVCVYKRPRWLYDAVLDKVEPRMNHSYILSGFSSSMGQYLVNIENVPYVGQSDVHEKIDGLGHG